MHGNWTWTGSHLWVMGHDPAIQLGPNPSTDPRLAFPLGLACSGSFQATDEQEIQLQFLHCPLDA